MATQNFPKYLIDGIDLLLTLDKSIVDIICASLEKLPIGAGPKKFQLLCEENGMPVEYIEIITRTIYGLGGYIVDSTSTEELIQNIIQSIDAIKKVPINELVEKQIYELLTQILSASNSLKKTFKIYDLLSSNDKTFRNSKIISDVRILFQEDLAKKDRSGVVIHQLQLNYIQEGVRKDIYLSLDIHDLQNLKGQIERAFIKEKEIIDTYKDISFINIED